MQAGDSARTAADDEAGKKVAIWSERRQCGDCPCEDYCHDLALFISMEIAEGRKR